MKKLIFALFWLTAVSGARAQTPVFEGAAGPETPIEQYFQEENPTYGQSMIFVFFNNEPCGQCPAAIELIEDIYDRYYKNAYGFSIINYQNDDEYNFIETYNLSRPLSVVLVRVNDGAVFGFEKLDDLENRVSDPVSFGDYFRFRVNSFLGGE